MNDEAPLEPVPSGETGGQVPRVSGIPPIPPPARQAPLAAGGVGLPGSVTLTNPWKRLGCALLESILVSFTLGIGWLIWAAVTAPNGQTPAKQMLRIRVIDAGTLYPVGIARMFWMRGLIAGLVAGVAFPFTLGILVFMPFWDARNQTLYEKVSGTLVVDDPLNAWRR